MKHLIILFLGLIFSVAMFAQDKPTMVTPDVNVTEAAYFTYTIDTLTNTDTDNLVIRTKTGADAQSFNAKLYIDWVSGSAQGNIIVQSSIDGVTYTNIDTLTYTGITADGWVTGVLTNTNYLYPYLKYTVTSSGTSVHIPTLWIYTKQ